MKTKITASRIRQIIKPHLLLLLSSVAIAHAQPKETIYLFNGVDLTGWTGANYEVNDGIITCRGKNLVTEKEFTNYILEFDFLLPPKGNNGLGIHYPGDGDPAYSGMELQILDDGHPQYKDIEPAQAHGSLYQLAAAKRGHLKPTGQWNSQKVTINGPEVTVELNGALILEANLDEIAKEHPDHSGVKRRSGHIAFCGHGDPVQFKNLRLRLLP